MNITSLSYTESGTGPTIVFLHGFCESKVLWTEFVEPLTQHFRIVTVDLPGHGESAVPEDFSMENQAEQVQHTLQQMGIDRFLLVGHSMGGYVSLALAEKYPEHLRGLCLFHSSALPDNAEKKESRGKTIAFIQKHGVEKFMETFVAPLFAESNREACRQDIEKMQEIGKFTLQDTVLGCLQAMRDRADRTHVLKEAKVPVFFLAGKEDPAVPLEAALQQVHLPENSMTYFMGNVGHMGMFERTEATRLALGKFAETVQPG